MTTYAGKVGPMPDSNTNNNEKSNWKEAAAGINSIVQASHVFLLLTVGVVGFAWHVETSLARHDMQIQQIATDHAEDRRGIGELRGDVEQIKLNMVTRGDLKEFLDQVRKDRAK